MMKLVILSLEFMLKRDILNIRYKFFSVSDICAVISHVCSFLHLPFLFFMCSSLGLLRVRFYDK